MKNTDYLCTMLCFVPSGNEKTFMEKYMGLADGYVVPYSALRIDRGEDEKMQLYRVIVMKHKKDDFRNQCQSQLRITCKEYSEEELLNKPAEEKEIEKLSNESQQKKHDSICRTDVYISPTFFSTDSSMHILFYTFVAS